LPSSGSTSQRHLAEGIDVREPMGLSDMYSAPPTLVPSIRHHDPFMGRGDAHGASQAPPPDHSIIASSVEAPASNVVAQASQSNTPSHENSQPPQQQDMLPTLEIVTPAPSEAMESGSPLPWEGCLDPEFLAELPREVRQDILLEHFPILTLPQSHAEVNGRTTHVHPLFLAALPSELQEEILALEARIGPVGGGSTEGAPAVVPDVTATVEGATAPPPPAAPESETLMLLSIVVEPEVRRDILMTCDLAELAGAVALHDEAVRLRAAQEAAQQAARAAQEARAAAEMARQEAQALALDAQRRAAVQGRDGFSRLHRFGRDDDDAFPLRPRDRNHHRMSRTEPPPSSWEALKTSPFNASSAVQLCRFLDQTSNSSASLISKILAGSLEGAPYHEIHAALHQILDFASKPLSSATAEQLQRVKNEADSSRSSSGRLQASRNPPNPALREGDLPPASFVCKVLGILAALLQRSRSVALSLILLPSDHMPMMDRHDAPPVLDKDVKESDEAHSSFVFRDLTAVERDLLHDLPFSRLLRLLQTRSETPEVADAVDTVLSILVQVMNSLEAEAGGATPENVAARVLPPAATAEAPVILHPRHPHPLQWADTLADARYQSRPYQCNLCRVTSFYWAFRCPPCHFDLCPGCAMDTANAVTQRARISRWGYWAVASTPLLSECASVLSTNVCKERTAVRLVCLLSRGIRLCSHAAAPTDDALLELEAILCKHAKDLMGGIREAIRRIEDIQLTLRHMSTELPHASAADGALSLMDQTALTRRKDSLISKALMLMELPEEMMRNVYLLFLPYAETQRSQLRPEIRLMFHASRVYLTEISNLLAQHPNRLRAVLPAAAFPLLNGYAQFHLLYGSNEGTESMSMAERSETERLLSEKQTDVSEVSDGAWRIAQARRAALAANNNSGSRRGILPDSNQQQNNSDDEREKLPHHIYKFCEGNRTLINTLIHWDPTLLDEGLKFITRAPRLVDLDFKLKTFRKTFARSRQRTQQQSITINRLNCFQDSFKALKDLQEPAPIHVRFQGEEGSDAGGLVREWFQILGEEMVNDDYALFVHSSEGMTYQPNPCSGVNSNHLDYFRFCGMVVGLAVYNDISVDVHFTRSVYRHMIGAEPCFRDVETIDPVMYTNLEKLLSMDITPEMNFDFTVTYERFGKTEEAELIPSGATTLVTNENKKEYIRLRSAFLMTKQIELQLQEFLTGFYRMVPRTDIQTFTEQELELVISGLPDIDVEDLRLNTEYSGYSASSPLIRWFWEIVSSMTPQDRANLLQFATGSSKVPLGGFSNLESGGHRHRFSITKTDSPIELLPSAHTCFNRIDVPDYPTAEMLREKLMLAITYGNKGFTMV
jgi:hypothetical protein